MKLSYLTLLATALISTALISTDICAAPRYEFNNGSQQLELRNSVYNLANNLQSKNCKIIVNVHAENDDAILMTLERHIYVELNVFNRKQSKTLTYSELNLHNWSKFEYQVKQMVLEIC